MTVWKEGDRAQLVLLNARPGFPVVIEGRIGEVDKRTVVVEFPRAGKVHRWRVAADSSFLTRL